MFCSGVDGNSGRAVQHGVGLAVKESIIREATWTQKLTNERLMSMTFNLTGKSNAVIFVVVYGPTDTVSNTREHKDVFWADLESAVSRVPSSDYLFVLKDANARTGVRMREKDCKVIGSYGRDTRVSDSNGTCGLRVTTSLPSSTHSSPPPRDARLVHLTVPGPRIGNVLTTSRDNHTASLSDMSLFTCSRMRIPTTTSCAPEFDSKGDSLVIENSRPPQGARVLTDELSRLTPTDAKG